MLPDRVLQFFEITHTWRTIWTDGRKLPENPPEPRWMGWSVGHWEGDTFVVASNGFEERPGLGNSQPVGCWTHSDEMKVVDRWRLLPARTTGREVAIVVTRTYTDPVGPAAA